MWATIMASRTYVYPFYGYGHGHGHGYGHTLGWNPGNLHYDLRYTKADISELLPYAYKKK
jgi:hypothetical protein